MSEIKLPAASGGGSISIKGPASSGSDVDLLDTSGNLKLSDDDELRLGASNDLQLYHNSASGGNGFIDNNTGNLVIRTNVASDVGGDIFIKPHDDENGIIVIHDGGVELYHDNSKKWETTANGCKLTGQLDIPDGSGSDGDNHIRIGNNFDLRIYHDGTHSYINNVTGELRCAASQFTVQNAAGNETLLYAVQDAGVGLKHNDNLKLETISTGVNITGGIRLGGNSSANEMDDYEEGSWTPTTNTATSVTYTNQYGRYTKVGNMVHIWWDLEWNNLSGTDNARMGGLPFTAVNTTSQGGYGAPQVRGHTGLSSDMRIYNNSSYFNSDEIVWRKYNSSGNEGNADYNTSGRVTGQGYYFVNNAY